MFLSCDNLLGAWPETQGEGEAQHVRRAARLAALLTPGGGSQRGAERATPGRGSYFRRDIMTAGEEAGLAIFKFKFTVNFNCIL